MIKFPSKHATLYGFSMIAYGLIMGNIIFLTKVLNINNKKKLAYLIFISFLLFYLEMLLILFIDVTWLSTSRSTANNEKGHLINPFTIFRFSGLISSIFCCSFVFLLFSAID